MAGYLLTLLMLIQTAAPAAAKDDIKESLDRAEALYYEAKFNDSIQLLMRVNEQLAGKPDRLADKANTKLQLALANVGLNDVEKAKSLLVDMYMLDPAKVLDPQQFSPRVVTLAGEAKAASVKLKCQAAGDDARSSVKSGNVPAVLNLLSANDKCVDLNALGFDAAELLYKTGLEAYKNADYSSALTDFQAALKFSPRHELATQYIDLAQGRLQVAEDRAVLAFQKSFDARNMSDAAVEFRKIASFNDIKLAPAVRQASEQYRKALTSLVDTWNQSCPVSDQAGMNDIRRQITELLPDPAFGEDIRAMMVPCAKSEPRAEVQPEPAADPRSAAKPEVRPVSLTSNSNTCMQLDYRVAMTRLNTKTRVEPEIPREARPYIQGSTVTVKVKVRIDESGNVVSTETPGGNPVFNTSVRNAVERWKFSPAMDATGARCVDTEIPIVFGPINSR